MEKLYFSESYLPNVISGVAIEIKKINRDSIKQMAPNLVICPASLLSSVMMINISQSKMLFLAHTMFIWSGHIAA